MIRNAVFDMGKVLMAWDPYLPCLRHAKDAEKAKALCKAIFTHAEWGPIIDGGVMTEKEYFAHARERLETQELKDIAVELEKDWTLDALYPIWGMERVLREVYAKGCKLYILSNCGAHFHDFEYRIPAFELFSGVLLSAEEDLLKPDPAIYRRLCDKFALVPEECLFVDDLQRNIDGAKSVGMEGYCFADGDVNRLCAWLNETLK